MTSKNSKPDWSGTSVLRGAHRQVHDRAKGVAIYWYARRGKGAPLLAVYRGATLAEARDAEDAGFAELFAAFQRETRPQAATGLMARVIADYRTHPAFTTLKPATQKTYRVWLNKIEEKFGGFAEHEVTDDAVAAWLKEIYTAHGARARDHALRILSRLASWGRHRERKLFSASFEPTKGFETLYRAPAQDPWTQADLEKIAKARPAVRNALMLALETGLRRADLCRVAWTNVDWEANVIRLVTSKGERKNRRIVVPLTPALKVVLQRIGVKREGPILTTRFGTAWAVNGLAHAINEELTALKVEGRLHGLRRSAATRLASQGLSSRNIARIMGWSEGDAEAMAAVYVSEDA